MTILLIGPKQKHLKIPEGWVQVLTGTVCEGDKFANVGNINSPFWESVDSEDEDWLVTDYEAIIRKESDASYQKESR